MQRSYQPEIMDDLDSSGPVIIQTLRELDTINRWLGGNAVSLRGLRHLLRVAPVEELHLVDLGCGGGDILMALARWGRRRGLRLRLTGIDANPHIIAYARARCADYPEIDFQAINIFDPAFAAQRFDVVHSSLFLHHFSEAELERLFRQNRQQARLGLLINDLHRHPLAYHSIRLLTRLFSRSPMVRHDAALSVARGFRRAELASLLKAAGLPLTRLRWAWAFRWQVVSVWGKKA